jgi:hypothetical protein
MSEDIITPGDIDHLTKKLYEFAEVLDDKEKKILMGVLELASKWPEGMVSQKMGKKTLPLVRETIRDLKIWDRLLETQAYSLWTCNGLPAKREGINPS